MTTRDVVVLGTSAGGVRAISAVVSGLPRDYRGSLFVVMHMARDVASALPQILARRTSLPCGHALDGEPIEPGRIYVAVPDRHLLVDQGRVTLAAGPREHGHRPAIDPLFRSAAIAYGRRVVGVVLSGARHDGAAGVTAIKRRGGLVVVQDPADADFDAMPTAALAAVPTDHVLTATSIAELLVALAREPLPDVPEVPPDDRMVAEDRIARHDVAGFGRTEELGGTRSHYVCPDCGGVLWELADDALLRYRCHIGHAYTAEELLDAQDRQVERALAVAVRTLEERVEMCRRLATRSRQAGREGAARLFDERARDAARELQLVRGGLNRDKGGPG